MRRVMRIAAVLVLMGATLFPLSSVDAQSPSLSPAAKPSRPCKAYSEPCADLSPNPYPLFEHTTTTPPPPSGDRSWGNCTWWAWQQVFEHSQVSLPDWGNAQDWWNGAKQAAKADKRISRGSTPRVGAIAVFGEGKLGHVGYVVAVSGSSFMVSYSNADPALYPPKVPVQYKEYSLTVAHTTPSTTEYVDYAVSTDSSLVKGYIYVDNGAPRPVVTGISPSNGPLAGGTGVGISGTALAGAISVNFGMTPATSVTVNSANSINAVAPAEQAGTVAVTVTTPAGTSATSSADQYTFVSPSQWAATGAMLLARYSSRATTLGDGTVLVEGGFAPGSYTAESELYSPSTGLWTAIASLKYGRGEHSATLLQNGKVLVSGGYAGPVLSSAELYDPSAKSWTQTGSMNDVRTRHTATLLPNGKVLVAGGWDGNMLASSELYDPAPGIWSVEGNMLVTRADHVAVLLPSGKVLVAGGAPVNNGFTSECELFDPSTGSWAVTGSLNVARNNFSAVLLPNGMVLAAGGNTASGPTATAELYNPATGTWTLTGSMANTRTLGLGQGLLPLEDGSILAAGGDTPSTSEVYVPASGAWLSPISIGQSPQCGAVTAMLSNGQAMIASGFDCVSPDNKAAVAYRYTP